MIQIVLGPTPNEFDPVTYFLPKGGLFRGPESQISYPEKKSNDEIRIICIGDSTTYGLALNYDKTYPFILEDLLKTRYPNHKIKVLNAGFPGASERQIKRIFQFHLIKYNPDIVIFRKELFHLSDSYAVSKNTNIIRYFLWRCLDQSRIFRVVSVATKRLFKGYPLYSRVYDLIMYQFSDFGNKIGGEFDSDFSVIKKIASENGAPFVMAVDYIRRTNENILINDCQQYMDKDFQNVACTYKAFEEKLKTVSIKDIFVDTEHFTEMGASILAHEIYQFLIGRKWIELLIDSDAQESLGHF